MNERGRYAHLKVTIMRSSLSALIAVGLIAIAGFSRAVPSVPGPGSTHPATQVAATYTVHVALPTGVRETDRASILAALAQVRPGGTVQFATGTYVVGEFVRIQTPQSRGSFGDLVTYEFRSD
jgi:hypothetical protein